jgi:phosphoesterase RecJ-like protein
MGIKEIVEAIKKYDNYLISSHINIEGDAIGSELALFYLIKQLGKDAILVNNNSVPDRYKFLPGSDKLIVINNNDKVKRYENVIVVDCPTIERSGRIAPLLQRAKIKINIDHHVSNENFGDFNWVAPEASSCGEMIFNLYKEMRLSINEEIATLLYVAILTDTGSFRYDSTTRNTHRIVGELIKLGVRPAKIYEKIYETKKIGDIELLAKALSTIKVTDNGKIAYIYVTKKMLDDTDTVADRTDGFVNFARSIDGSEISIFFREDASDPQKIHVGFRSKDRANVNVLASKFGGGGHPKASGCSLKGPLLEVIAKVLKSSEEFLLQL